MMAKRALLVGINRYESAPNLSGSILDAEGMKEVLERHEDGKPNYNCRLLTDPGSHIVTRDILRQQWELLFKDFTGDILFYFSGHGATSEMGGALMTFEGTNADPGLSMHELIELANGSRAREVLLILDCCFSGSLGNRPEKSKRGKSTENLAQLREGVTILAASRPTEPALETQGQGVFTELVIAALEGGAADVRGNISAAGIYAYVEQALGPWEQRPLYKSYANCLTPVRCCAPAVPDTLLRQLPKLFPDSKFFYPTNPSFERTHPSATEANIEIFKMFVRYRDARLLATVSGEDLYFTVMKSGSVKLTPLGRFYWRLAKEGRF